MALEYKFDQGQLRVNASDSKKKLCWYLLIFVLLLNVGGLAWLFLSGYLMPVEADAKHSFATSLRGKMNEQKHLLTSQKETIKKLTQELGILKREQKIQIVANDKLNGKLQLAETKLGEAKEEILLYGNILNKKDLKQGLHIQSFGLKPVKVDKDGKKIAGNTRFRYRVILSYIRSDDSIIKGNFSISIIGKQNGSPTTLKHQLLVPKDGGTALTGFSLKYYQSLTGEMELPDGFSPEKVKLIVSPSSGSKLEKTRDWVAATKQ